MRRISLFIATFFLILVTVTTIGRAQQVIGDLYTRDGAAIKFGPVQDSVLVKTSTVENLTSLSPDYILINQNKDTLIITDNNRKILYSTNKSINSINPGEALRIISTSVLSELLLNGGIAGYVSFEIRGNNILTITKGEETLEGVQWCPPICP